MSDSNPDVRRHAGSIPVLRTKIRRCTQEVEEIGLENREAGNCAWVQILPTPPYGTLAQLVERQTEDLRVGGPIPPGPTIWESGRVVKGS